jgi:hypothetical protein
LGDLCNLTYKKIDEIPVVNKEKKFFKIIGSYSLDFFLLLSFSLSTILTAQNSGLSYKEIWAYQCHALLAPFLRVF